MATFVLVHGAWQGASTWDLMVPYLTAKGHRVLAPALTGLGQRRHELSPQVTVDMHIADVVEVFEYEDLHDVVLAGHSYAGSVVTAATEKIAPRLKALVYVDGFVPRDGETTMQLLPPAVQDRFRASAQTEGDGWRLPGSEKQLDGWGLKPGSARDFVKSKLCDFSLRCFEGQVRLPQQASEKVPRAYVSCTAEGYPARPAFAPFAARAKAQAWPVLDLPTGHDCHVEEPKAVADFLMSLG
jgi:pimeloyl-ACP methyl ester carboxylesterase